MAGGASTGEPGSQGPCQSPSFHTTIQPSTTLAQPLLAHFALRYIADERRVRWARGTASTSKKT
eukprot:scaffold297327_cov35-Tisochrysis_lutea.AAC.4